MKKQTILLACFTAGALLLTGCSNNAQTGALVGSLVGAGIGKSTSNHHDKRAVIGGLLGGIVGSAIGAEKDRANYNRSANYQSSANTTPYYQNGTSNKTVTQNTNVSHRHGNRTHTHPGGSVNHTHNNDNQAAQQVVVGQPEYIYVERPPAYYYPPVSTSIVLGLGYYGGYSHGYNRRYNRHNRYRNHNRGRYPRRR